jgi:dTDP-4-amino-4,6-dideoxy-D-galactose acyltransferase
MTAPVDAGEKLCEVLDWDSGFFGRRIARLLQPRLSARVLAVTQAWMARSQIECLYFRCSSTDSQSIALAERHGFDLVDIRVTLERQSANSLGFSEANLPVVKARPEQVAQLQAIARLSHKDSRFYQDSHFDATRCDELYAAWIENSCRGYADAVFASELEQSAVGYITCHLEGHAEGRIGLLAVSENARRGGVGSALVKAALEWFRARQRFHVSVVTQGRNIGSQRLYQRCGFVTSSVELWYHYWPAA